MKITPTTEAVAAELEAWALAAGWKTVAGLVAAAYHSNGGGELLPVADSETGLRNVVQRLRRIFRGYDGPRYSLAAEELKSSVLSALPAARRDEILKPDDPSRLATIAAQEGIEAVNAVHLRASPDVIMRETSQAIAALVAMRNAAVKYFEHVVCT
jgi:hypothetical protein